MAGLAAAAAYLLTNLLDMRLLRYPQNDLMLQGRMVPLFRPVWPLAGLVLHTGFSLALTALYAAARDRLPGPPWLRGVLFLQAENTALWTLVPLIDRYHPAVRDGQMPPLNTPRCFLQAVLRHLVFGAVMGALLGEPRRAGAERTAP
jgi:hypothetical protein